MIQFKRFLVSEQCLKKTSGPACNGMGSAARYAFRIGVAHNPPRTPEDNNQWVVDYAGETSEPFDGHGESPACEAQQRTLEFCDLDTRGWLPHKYWSPVEHHPERHKHSNTSAKSLYLRT